HIVVLCAAWLTLLLLTYTLFPYTTLFRSADLALLDESGERAGHLLDRNALVAAMDVIEIDMIDAEPLQRPLQAFAQIGLRIVELDRKSTRLNSSHVKISYAVFCLKKKQPK